jgi:hypothetical protein
VLLLLIFKTSLKIFEGSQSGRKNINGRKINVTSVTPIHTYSKYRHTGTNNHMGNQ